MRDHPTVQRFHELQTQRTHPTDKPRVLDADWLRQLCLDCGADDVGFVEPGRVPRVARLMALAIRFEAMLRDGVVASQAELAALGHVSCSRVSQIMNLLLLAPDIQEEILHLPRTLHGRDRLQLCQLQPIAAVLDWRKQRQLWRELVQ